MQSELRPPLGRDCPAVSPGAAHGASKFSFLVGKGPYCVAQAVHFRTSITHGTHHLVGKAIVPSTATGTGHSRGEPAQSRSTGKGPQERQQS